MSANQLYVLNTNRYYYRRRRRGEPTRVVPPGLDFTRRKRSPRVQPASPGPASGAKTAMGRRGEQSRGGQKFSPDPVRTDRGGATILVRASIRMRDGGPRVIKTLAAAFSVGQG